MSASATQGGHNYDLIVAACMATSRLLFFFSVTPSTKSTKCSRRCLVAGFTQRDEIRQIDRGVLLYITTQIGERLPRGNGLPVYLPVMLWALHKRLNRSRCCLGGRIGCVHVSIIKWVAHWRHLANMTNINVRRRCGLMSHYFNHLLLLGCIAVLRVRT